MSNQDFDPSYVPDPTNVIALAQRSAIANVATSVEDDPDKAARAMDLAEATGQHPSVVYNDLEEHELQFKAKLSSDLIKNNPHLQDYVNSHPLAAKVSNDDYAQLDAVSESLQKYVGAPGVGYVPEEPNSVLKAGVKGFLENADFGGLGEEHQKLADMLASNPVFANIFVRQGALAGADLLEGTNRIAGGVIGGAAAMIGEAYKQAGGNEAQAARLTRDLITLAQVGLSGQAGLHGIVAPEVHAMIQEAAQVGKTISPYVLAGKEPPVGIHPVLDEFKAEQAKLDADNLGEALKESVKSATRERSPELFANYIRGITDGSIGISADAVRALYGDKVPSPDDGILGFVPDLAAQLSRAEATGGDINVSVADWLAKVEPDVAKELGDHIRARPEGLTLEESKNLEPTESQPTPAPQSQADFGEHFPFEHQPLPPNDERIQNISNNIDTLTNELKRQYPKLSQQLGGVRDYFRSANDNGVDIHAAIEELGDTLDFVEKNGGHTEVTSRLSKMIEDLEDLSDDPLLQQSQHSGEVRALHRSYQEHFDTFVNPKPGTVGASMPRDETISGLKQHLEKLTRTTELNKAKGRNGLGDKALVAERLATEDAIKALEAKQPEVDTVRQAAGLQGIQERKLELRRVDEDNQITGEALKDTKKFTLHDETGNQVGDMFLSEEKEGKRLYVDDIQGAEGARSLGPRAMRDVLEQIAQQYPNAETLEGMRVSGAREKANKENVKAGIDLNKVRERATTRAKQLELDVTRLEDKEAFEKASAIGMTVDQYKRYQKLIDKRAEEDAKAAESRAMADQRKRQTEEWKSNRAELRPRVKTDLEARADVELDEMLREGRVKLSREGLTDDQIALLPKDYVSTDGIHPQDLAGLFGDTDHRGLVDRVIALAQGRDAAGMKPEAYLRRLVDVETDRQMEAKYGNLESNILDEAKDQVLSQTQEDLLHEEVLARASEAGLEYSIKQGDLKAAIKDFFDRQLVRDVDSDKSLAESGRAARAAEMALLKGDYAEAFRQKQRQYNAIVMANYAKRFEKAQARFEKLADKYQDRVLSGVDQEYTNWIRDILLRTGKLDAKYAQDLAGLIDHSDSGIKTLGEFVDYKEHHDLREVPVAEYLTDPNFKKQYENLPVADAQELHDSVRALDKNGRDEKKYIRQGEAFDLAELKKQLTDSLQAFKEIKYDTEGNRVQMGAKVRGAIRTAITAHLQVETVFNRLDRFDPKGPWNQFVFRPLAEAANHEARLEKEFARKLGDIADKADLKEVIPNDIFKNPFDGSPMRMTRKNLRAVLLNAGNDSNLFKMTAGYKIGSESLGGRFVPNRAIVKDWLNQHATKEDWDWGQRVWDMLKELGERSDTMYRGLTGVAPEKLRIDGIDTPHGRYDGGYYPLIRHELYGEDIKLAKNDLEGAGYIRATTAAGYTKKRTGATYPLSLDLDALPNTMRQIIHDTSYRPAVIEAGKIFYDNAIKNEFKKHLGTEVSDMFVPWLKDVANTQNYYAGKATKQFIQFSDFMRQNAVTTLVGLNPSTVLKHTPTALMSSMAEVGPKNFLKAVSSLLTVNEETGNTNWQFAMKTSEELQRRMRNWVETMGGGMRYLENEQGTFMHLRDVITQFASKPVALGDLISAVPTWMAKYTAEMEEHGVHGDAVYAADKSVRQAHGSSAITSKSQVARARSLSWFTGFFTFFNDLFNRQVETLWKAGEALDLAKEARYGEAMKLSTEVAGRTFAYVIAPAIIEELVTPLSNDQNESWGKKAAKGLGFTLSSSYVFVREIANAMLNGRDPAAGLLTTSYKALTDMARDLGSVRPKPGNIIKHGATLAGMLTGMVPAQVGRTAEFLQGKEKPKGPWGWLVGARYGTLQNHSPTFDKWWKGKQ